MPRFRNPVVSTANIIDGSITSSKLADDAVTTAKLADLAVEAAKLADSSVTATKIANLAVGTAAIANAAVTNAKIDSLSASKITAGTISTGTISVATLIELASGGTFQTAPSGSRRIRLRSDATDRLEFVSSTNATRASLILNSANELLIEADSAARIIFIDNNDPIHIGDPLSGTGGGLRVNAGDFRVAIGGFTDFLVTDARVEAFEQLRIVGGLIGGLPPLAFTNDLNTGIYPAGTDSFGIMAGGASKMTFGVQIRSDVIRTDTTASGANMVINSTTGQMQRSTSSKRYKTAIRPWDHRGRALDLRPVLFRSKLESDDGRRAHLGLIAEEVADVLPVGAVRDANGRPEALNWPAITTALIADTRELERRVAVLEAA